jgi:hypothetical protein
VRWLELHRLRRIALRLPNLLWRAAGASWTPCAMRLDERGIRTPRGERWNLSRGRMNLARFFRG